MLTAYLCLVSLIQVRSLGAPSYEQPHPIQVAVTHVDLVETKKWIGKNVWVFSDRVMSGYTFWPDQPMAVKSIERSPYRTCLSYQGHEVYQEDSAPGFWADHPLVLTLRWPTGMKPRVDPYGLRAPECYRVVVADWWHLRLCATLHGPLPKRIPKKYLDAIRSGDFIKGMSKQECLLSRGHPDWTGSTANESFASNDWEYVYMAGA